ncbi:MAG: DUF2231 domain-containing protein [Candidatus Dormibacteria bacterium]
MVDRLVRRLSFLPPVGEWLNQILAKLGAKGGQRTGQVKDLLNGTWLGHALHPAVTDLPIGAWTGSTLLDLARGGSADGLGRGADLLPATGCAGALGAVAIGLADWQDKYGQERDLGSAHALINSGALMLFTPLSGPGGGAPRGWAVGISLLGLGTAYAGAYAAATWSSARGSR